MRILALDSAVGSCSAAVWADGAVLAEEQMTLSYGHAEVLMPLVARVLARAGLGVSDMDRLACTVGPGHFTGLRAGLAAARGLALAADKPLVGVTTLAAVAAGVPEAQRAGRDVLVALDSKRAEVYAQRFDAQLRPLGDAVALTQADLAERERRGALLVVGDAAPAVIAALVAAGQDAIGADAPALPQARLVAAIAASAPLPGAPPAPLYLHPPAITTPKPRVVAATGAP